MLELVYIISLSYTASTHKVLTIYLYNATNSHVVQQPGSSDHVYQAELSKSVALSMYHPWSLPCTLEPLNIIRITTQLSPLNNSHLNTIS